MRTFLKLVVVLGALGPSALAWFSAHGANQWILAGAIGLYAVGLGATAWRLEKQTRWSGVGLCLAVLLLGMLIVYLTHRRLFVR
jgi:hypothetical protein